MARPAKGALRPAAAAGRAAPKKKAKPAPEPAAAKATPAPTTQDVPTSSTPRGPTRYDFDDRLVQGQTNKSGAVYLFDRKELQVRSMVNQRTSFRDQIAKDMLSE